MGMTETYEYRCGGREVRFIETVAGGAIYERSRCRQEPTDRIMEGSRRRGSCPPTSGT
jgi:hypothetical protein